MLNVPQFRTDIVRPTLQAIAAHNEAAENLVLGTGLQESLLHFVRQLGGGPARGIYQMEPPTHDDIWDNYLRYRPEVRARVEAFLVPGQVRVAQLTWNLAYATAMCRVHYMRVPEPLPAPEDVAGLAGYWKQHYNTPLGRGTTAEFVERYETYSIATGRDPHR